MTDRRREVPVWAFLNAMVVQEALAAGELDRALRHVEALHQLQRGALNVINLGYLLSLLYCLFVVPRELWLKDDSHPIFAEIPADALLDGVDIAIKPRDFAAAPVQCFLRHLRNAVAHVRFSIGDGGEFTFWDQRTESSDRVFQATVSQAKLESLVSAVGAKLANLSLRSGGVH